MTKIEHTRNAVGLVIGVGFRTATTTQAVNSVITNDDGAVISPESLKYDNTSGSAGCQVVVLQLWGKFNCKGKTSTRTCTEENVM